MRFEVLIIMTMMITVFWSVMPCGLVKVTNVLEQPLACIFYPEDEGSRLSK
jgi:hypothetical protein